MAGKLTQAQKVRNVIVVAVILAIIGVVLYLARNNAANAEVGDCMKQTGPNSLEQVACDDSAAKFKVVGRVENKTETEATLTACDAYKSQGAQQVYWWGKSGGKGFVLCLAPTTK
jgi:hypothetical protein